MARPKSVLLEDKPSVVARKMTAKQIKFAELRAEGVPISAAARLAGFAGKGKHFQALERHAGVQEVVAEKKAEIAAVLNMTRQHVLDGHMEAIQIARTQGDPHAMIKGWTEIGKMCGFYAPEVKKIDVSISAKRLLDQFETMSDDELLKLAEKTLDGTFERVEEAPGAPQGLEKQAEAGAGG